MKCSGLLNNMLCIGCRGENIKGAEVKLYVTPKTISCSNQEIDGTISDILLTTHTVDCQNFLP